MEEEKHLGFREFVPPQKRRLLITAGAFVLILSLYLALSCFMLYNDKVSDAGGLKADREFSEQVGESVASVIEGATMVTCGTYIENIEAISLRNSEYTVVFEVWFSWYGETAFDFTQFARLYKGTVAHMEILTDYHEGNEHYQRLRVKANVSEDFWTRRFPLDSHRLSLYIESEYPISQVVLVPDYENSGVNEDLSVPGYRLQSSNLEQFFMNYENTRSDPTMLGEPVTSEVVTDLFISRDGFGLYVRCFVALIGTITWVMITLYINTYHHVDPLGMIPGALFGTVSNVLVGANLLPDALQLGLLEFVNFYGVLIILLSAVSIISVNRIRRKYEDNDFAKYFGRVMFVILLFFAISGNILLPAISYSV
ncbi:MAG: hypothetical protein Q4B42_06170 [Oscillospiraceae bacterium]|nr:hypothetical protein [Oscillospiraceae bacterium]